MWFAVAGAMVAEQFDQIAAGAKVWYAVTVQRNAVKEVENWHGSALWVANATVAGDETQSGSGSSNNVTLGITIINFGEHFLTELHLAQLADDMVGDFFGRRLFGLIVFDRINLI